MPPEPIDTTLATYWARVDDLDRSEAESAWRWFVSRYRGFVQDVLRRFLGSADAEAASDEFWGYLFSSGVIERADRSRRLRAFLVGVLRNYAHDWRRRNTAPHVDMAAVADPATVDLDEDEELALWAENVLRNALDEMRRRWPTNAEVIRLFYGVGATGETPVSLSVSEIASRLSCAPNAVHQALHRGRKRLRGCLQNELVRLVGVNEMTSEIPLIVGALGRTRRGLIDE